MRKRSVLGFLALLLVSLPAVSQTTPAAKAADWDLAVKALVESLDKFKVPQKEKDELLAIASSLKADIVEKP